MVSDNFLCSASMTPARRSSAPPALLIGLLVSTVFMLSACGGGGGGTADAVPPPAVAEVPKAVIVPITTPTVAATPQSTGNTATDGFNQFNYRRLLMGESALIRNTDLDRAAMSHSQYQQLNNVITHDEIVSKPGFTGATVPDRLTAAGYRFTQRSYAYGEVISSTVDQSGVNAAEDLITAIYHRFAIFEPSFRQAGAGAGVSSAGRTYFTVDLTADGLTPALGNANFVVYPFAGQMNLPRVFFSDYESPDPVPNRNQVGYPISVHADITAVLSVQSFTVKPRNGMALTTQLLSHANDPETPASAAAIIPLDVLSGATTYDVQFAGTIDGVSVSRAWSFTTQ
jgi:uncharacterized protein YkwD